MADLELSEENKGAKHPGGRPMKFESVDELDAAIEQYLGACGPHKAKRAVVMEKDDGTNYWAMVDYMTEQKPVTVSGAAYALGTTRRTLLNYKDRQEFLPSIERLLAACEAYTESMLYSNASNGAKFSLVNNFQGKHVDWADKQVMAGDPEAPLGNPLAGLTTDQLKKLAEEPDDAHADSANQA